MPLLGSAAMLLSFDVDADAVDEHDRWHTCEHLPERLSIPGFHRGTRWVAVSGAPRYMVLYEVEDLATLSSPAYLARLDDPTPWTSRMMACYRGMRRGLCSVLGSFGHGQGGDAALIRFGFPASQTSQLHRWLLEEALPRIPGTRGLGSAHLLRGAQAALMTNEQRIRGADRGVDAAIVLTGYDGKAVAEQAHALVAAGLSGLAEDEIQLAAYRFSYTLDSAEVRDRTASSHAS
jgi:hypothetical protein